MTAAPGMFAHLERMADARGLFEHADRTAPRIEHGYCTDDNARLLVVASRERDADAPAALSRCALNFTVAAVAEDGRAYNRMNAAGEWTDVPSTDDCWGRALWGLGVAANLHDDEAVRFTALGAFERGARQRSRWSRSMAFAALGASDVTAAFPGHEAAISVLRDAVVAIGPPGDAPWAWPEPELRYANAALAEAVIAAGAALLDDDVLNRGLAMLGWLLDRESRNGHLSVTAVGGAGPYTHGAQFDQQPIEVAAMADACWRAFALTGESRWAEGVGAAVAWFEGVNDAGAVMRDLVSGGGYDGLHPHAANLNEGAESTLALVSTLQRGAELAQVQP